ncbi:hypothetical protein BJ742DRAFT_310720 [Cladochytrium replicatum]|nr:hypothetical protein BJ742DRAFT_310720 [Cladochytrium replicatum]
MDNFSLFAFLEWLWVRIIATFAFKWQSSITASPKNIDVSAIYIYPVKSCRGIRVNQWPIDKNGFELDRFWMIVSDTEDYKFVTQRENPNMVLIEPRLEIVGPDGTALAVEGLRNGNSVLNWNDLYNSKGRMVLKAPGMARDLVIPFKGSDGGVRRREVRSEVWGKPVVGFDQGDEAAAWVSEYLGFPARIISKNNDVIRPLTAKHVPSRNLFDDDPQTAFADGYPFLLCSEESLSELNSRLASGSLSPDVKSLNIHNFRPNIVVRNVPTPFYEDTILQLHFIPPATSSRPALELFVCSRCTRCQMPNVDIQKGVMRTEPLKTLMKFRRVDKGDKYSACFGVNCVCAASVGYLAVGDGVRVDQTGFHDRRGVWWGKKPSETMRSEEALENFLKDKKN